MPPNLETVEQRWFTLSEASELLGIHPTTLRDWADSGKIPALRTPGGHRRFDVRDLQAFLQRRRIGSTGRELTVAERNPLENIRQQFGSNQIARQRWYQQLSEEQRAKDRATGQRMLGLLIQYTSRHENADHFLEQARGLAREYGKDLAEAEFTPSGLVRAFLFVRRAILNATHQPQDVTALNDAESMRLYQRINSFMDEMLLSTLDAYEQAGGGKKPKHIGLKKSLRTKRGK
ncbi:MAG: helix-turn-helix domain-containing protein [Chloroflexi bacterium]|nr:helix-turn-helix domain-containing protein [Chloroflexota bacterium]